jgi:signal transduction histidine kinase
MLMREHLCAIRLSSLLAHREPAELAAEGIAVLISDFGAEAGSLFCTGRLLLRVRHGHLPEVLVAQVDQWEANVARRLAAGPWAAAERGGPLLSFRPVEGTGRVLMYSLIQDREGVIGALCLVFPQSQVPSGAQREQLAAFLQPLCKALLLVADLSLTKKRLNQLNLFYEVSQSVFSGVDLDVVLNSIMRVASDLLNASAYVLMLVDERTETLVVRHAYGEAVGAASRVRLPLDEGLAGWVITNRKHVVINDAFQDDRLSSTEDGFTKDATRSVLIVPIEIWGQTAGVLEVLNKRDSTGFNSQDLDLALATAHQVGTATENARLYQGLRDEKDRILQAQESVRREVARNLHDGTVQFLSAIAMGIDHLERLLEFKPEAARSELVALRDMTRQATKQARLALFELRPLILETQGLVPALEAYVHQLGSSERFCINLEVEEALPGIDGSIATTIFAITQEAMANAKKHASARNVWLRVSTENEWLQVVVQDDGVGFDPDAVAECYDQQGSIGLLSMRERAELINGYLEIESCTTHPDPGTKVTLRVPIVEREDKSPLRG